ncbi:MAG TPA: NAD(P)H-hydrate dehydratase [Thermotogota bacterium]|nr:NAD(P)H-hydrate dehydratase [Thermotogota bacterium]HRW34558.1 NAD(P)H-hydrate dehydratase [Thermotogota bacterium]
MIPIKILTPAEMNRCDQATIQNGLPAIVLMERAAHSVVHAVLDEMDGVPEKTLILCGIGNNAGDGLCMARELTDLSSDCTVLMTMGLNKLSENAKREFNLLSKKNCTITTNFQSLENSLHTYDLIVDAIFGTGLDRPIPESVDAFLEKINCTNAYKCAVDVPTGINAYSGSLYSNHPFKADLTVTFAFPKSGMFFYPARKTVGKLKCSYIGISNETPETIGWEEKYWMNAQTAKKIQPTADPDAHKSSMGRIAVIGGSVHYKGAPLLTLMGALKSGAGMVQGILPSYDHQMYFTIPPEIILKEIDASHDYHGMNSLDEIVEYTQDADTLVIGPGMGRAYTTTTFVREFVMNTEKPLVIDADGLFAFSSPQALELLAKRSGRTILTPHMGEFSRLTGKSIEQIKANRFGILKKFAQESGCTVVLKDSTTLIGTSQGQLIVNTTGNEGLACGGSGDVLAGIIGTYLAKGMAPHRAAQLGVYIHGLAADLYKEKHHSSTFTPSILCEMLDTALLTLNR